MASASHACVRIHGGHCQQILWCSYRVFMVQCVKLVLRTSELGVSLCVLFIANVICPKRFTSYGHYAGG